jgi:hypothetical protein
VSWESCSQSTGGHAHRFEKLYQFGCTDDELKAALDLFAETESREAKDHPTPNEATLEKCRKQVLESIGSSGWGTGTTSDAEPGRAALAVAW